MFYTVCVCCTIRIWYVPYAYTHTVQPYAYHQENICISNSSADYWNNNNMPNVTLYDGRIYFSRIGGNFLWVSWCRKELNLLIAFPTIIMHESGSISDTFRQSEMWFGWQKPIYYSCNRKCHIPNHGVIRSWGDVSAKLNYFGPGHMHF